jgi:hypothetical protein
MEYHGYFNILADCRLVRAKDATGEYLARIVDSTPGDVALVQ